MEITCTQHGPARITNVSLVQIVKEQHTQGLVHHYYGLDQKAQRRVTIGDLSPS